MIVPLQNSPSRHWSLH